MHELPITQSILDIAVDAANKAHAQRVTAINLVVGELSSIIDDSVQFYFDLLSKNTVAEGAALRFERLPGAAACRDCGHTYMVTPPLSPFCPACGKNRVQVTGGRELRVDSIEVD